MAIVLSLHELWKPLSGNRLLLVTAPPKWCCFLNTCSTYNMQHVEQLGIPNGCTNSSATVGVCT